MNAFVLKQLRGHVVGGSILLALWLLFELDEIDELACEAKVTELEHSILVDQNIRRSSKG